MIVAVLGAPGSFSEMAARRLVGPGAWIRSVDTFDALFGAVALSWADYGVVPVHNTIAGPVDDNAARARDRAFRVIGYTRLAVQQCLIARRGTPLDAVRRIASHPVALRQCTRFFADRPWCVPVAISDTGRGVRGLVSGQMATDAVIGAAAAARRYGASVLMEGVQDARENFTEFVMFERRVVSREARVES